MSNTRTPASQAILSDSEPATLYKILAREELDIATRYKFLKKFRSTSEGMAVLDAALSYAKDVEQRAFAFAKHDPYDRSDYNDFEAKTKIPKRVVGDLQDNIRMGKIVQAHPRLFADKKDNAQHIVIDQIPAIYSNR